MDPRSRNQSKRVFGQQKTNQPLSVLGNVAGAERENVNLRAIKKRGSNENSTTISKKLKLVTNTDDQENSIPNRGKEQIASKEKSGKDDSSKSKPVENGGVNITGLRTSVNEVESHVRSLEISEDDFTRRSTRNGAVNQGLLGQFMKVVASVPSLVLPTEIATGPSKPKRAVAVPLIKNPSRFPCIDFSDPSTYYEAPACLPEDVEDFDKTQVSDATSEPHYADSVFKYYQQVEKKHQLSDYMMNQKHVTKAMRSVLVDWMVEVQESFELNHETLYLGVKLVDHYLSKEVIAKEKFQLLGATCLFIAAKFDVSYHFQINYTESKFFSFVQERIPPSIEDFLYICDDAYLRRDLISFEMEVFKKLGFFVGFAISYRFLRRYARVAKLTMEQLTLARYILEMSLMDYDVTCFEKDSKVAAAALLLASRMKGLSWSMSLEFYSGYEESDLITLMNKLNDLISCPVKTNKTVKLKYSHKIFFEVAKIPPLSRN